MGALHWSSVIAILSCTLWSYLWWNCSWSDNTVRCHQNENYVSRSWQSEFFNSETCKVNHQRKGNQRNVCWICAESPVDNTWWRNILRIL